MPQLQEFSRKRWAEIEDISSDAAYWLHLFPPQHCASVCYEGIRYGHVSSNIEELKRWILEAQELPLIQKIVLPLLVTMKHMHKKYTQFLDKLSGENQVMPRRLMTLKLSDHPSSVDHQDVQERKDYVWRNSIARNIPSIAVGVTKLDIIRPLAKKEE
ncbi:hypothetical protein NL676_034923 [Syzygium grande]|nr:hypothetical protein NL676_034923 [Syzygium grande]